MAVLVIILPLCFIRSVETLERTPVTYMMLKWEKYDAFLAAAGKCFEGIWNNAHPERPIRICYEAVGGRYNMKLNTRAVANTLPDIFVVQDYIHYAKKGLLLDLTPYIERNQDDDFLGQVPPMIIDSLKLDGKLHALPSSLGTEVMYYNRRLFRQAGVPYPDETWDWSRMLDAAHRLTVRDGRGRVCQYGMMVGMSWIQFLQYNGADVWSKDLNRCIIDSKESREAMQFLLDLAYRHGVAPEPPESGMNEGTPEFIQERVAMFIGNRWHTAFFRNAKNLDWAVAPLPRSFTGLRRARASFYVLAIHAETPHPDIAYAFLKYLAGPEQNREFVSQGVAIPMCNPAHYDEVWSDLPEEAGAIRAYQLTMQDAISRYDRSFVHPELKLEVWRWRAKSIMGQCIKQRITVPEAFAQLERALQSDLESARAGPPCILPSRKSMLVISVVTVLVLVLWLKNLRKRLERSSSLS